MAYGRQFCRYDAVYSKKSNINYAKHEVQQTSTLYPEIF